MNLATTPKCNDERRCFAKVNGRCGILIHSYKKGEKCPFNKPQREVTNGVYYELKKVTDEDL